MAKVATTSPLRIAQAERRTQYVNLRKAGYTHEHIAAQFGVTRQAVCQGIQKALQAQQAESVGDLRALENERLDDLLRAIYQTAVQGDHGAIDRILRIMERRAKLWGLDAPVRQELSGPEGGPVAFEEVSLSDDERAERIAALFDRARARATGQVVGDDAGLLAGRASKSEAA